MDANASSMSLPFHVARAYGLGTSIAPGARTVNASRPATARLSTGGSLVSARVDRPVDFIPGPKLNDGVLQLYRNPADRNAAATEAAIGRRIDVQA